MSSHFFRFATWSARHSLVALVVTARRFTELDAPSSCCGLCLTHHAVRLIPQLRHMTDPHLIIAPLADPCAFIMPLATNWVYSLFAGLRHRGGCDSQPTPYVESKTN